MLRQTTARMGLTGEKAMSMVGNREGQIDSTRLIIPGLAGLYQSIAPYSYAIIRFCVGAILIYHGYGKLFGGNIASVAEHVVTPLGLPMPMAWAYFIGILEFFGGAALAIGFLTRPIALMLTLEFIVITFMARGQWLLAFPARTAAMNIRCSCCSFMPRSSFGEPGAVRSTG